MSDQQKYVNKLAGKRVLVVGGSSGIGFCVAEAALEQGSTVILSSSRQSRLDEAVQRLQKAYPSRKDKISAHACGLADEDTLEKNVEELYAFATSNGSEKLDHIVYTAGDPLAMMKIETADLAKIKQAGMVRFFAPLIIAKHAPKYLNKGPTASITLTTGAVSERPRPDWSVVGSYATGLHGMTRGLALDLAPIRVNLISPGAVETELWDALPEDKKQELFKHASATAPTQSIGKPEDVAESYIYCMRDANVTGSVISTNSGSLLV